MSNETTPPTTPARADSPALTGSAVRWTREECLEGMWELYRDYCQLESERDGCDRTILPDYEDMLRQIEQHGLPAPPNAALSEGAGR